MTNKVELVASEESSVSSLAKAVPALIEKFVIRLPNGLRTQIKTLSENNRRSMNSEIIMVLEKHIQQNHTIDLKEFETDIFAQAGENIDDDTKNVELNRRLDSLTAEKKEALLELLG